MILRIVFQIFQKIEICVGEVGVVDQSAVFRRGAITFVLSRQKSLCDGVIGQHGDIVGVANGDKIRLDAPVEHVPGVLGGDKSFRFRAFSLIDGSLHLCAGVIGTPVIANLACCHEIFEPAQGFGDWRFWIGPVLLE